MPDQLPTQDYLRAIVAELAACTHGGKSGVLARAQAQLGISKQAMYGRLAAVGFDSGRKRRVDAGTMALERHEAEQIAAMIKAATRQTGKRLLSVADTVDVLRTSGKIAARRINTDTGEVIDLSTSAILRSLEAYGLHHKQLAAPAPHVQLASLHPNHVWEIDFSVCVLFYLRGDQGLRVMKESQFNKNKPANIAKVENDRVQRIVIADHTSHLLWPTYVHGAECATSAIDALIRAFCIREGVPYYGVPLVIYTDQGPAFKNGLFANFCRRALITHIMHESASQKDDAARATGSVEVANNIVERSFEGRLGIGYRVQDVVELQSLADRWSKWFNTTQRHSRHGMTRTDAWLRITELQLRKPPAEDVLRQLAHTNPETRTVVGNLTIPWKGVSYALRDIPGLSESLRVGQKINVVTNPYTEGGIIVVTQSADGKDEIHYPIGAPEVNDWGYASGAPIIGESFASLPETDAQRANKRLAQIAMGVDNEADARDAKKAKLVAFAGIDPHAPLVTPDVTYLPKRGTDLAASAPVYVAPVTLLSLIEAARALRDRIGPDAWTPEHYAALARYYPDGLPESDLDQAAERITGRTRLRVVAGSGS